MLTTTSWHSYGSIYHVGHKAIDELFNYPCRVEEKVDGSQFRFGVHNSYDICDQGHYGSTTTELRCASKGAQLYVDAPEKMFKEAVATAKNLQSQLHIGWTYYGEYLKKPKHNTLAYDRVPKQHIILFDIARGEGDLLSRGELEQEALRLDLEVVELVDTFTSRPTTDDFRRWLETDSVLGGQKIEGIVIKPLVPVYGRDKKILMAKYVSENFREIHSGEWRKNNPTKKDIIDQIAEEVCTPARYEKAHQHLRESGSLEGSVRDIGKLIKEIPIDVRKECEDQIRDRLFEHFWPHIRRILSRGVPEWYKEKLMKDQLNGEN